MTTSTRTILPVIAILLFSCSQEESPSSDSAALKNQPTEVIIEASTPETENKGETIQDQVILTSNQENDTTYTFASMEEYYNSLEVKAQSFIINTSLDNVIKGEKGTEILVRKDCFVNKDGKEIIEPVTIELKEYFSMADFIFNGMHSLSKGELIETGGMFHITVSLNGEEVFLKEGQAISFKIPTDNKKEGMQYFQGIETDNGLDWVAQGSTLQTDLQTEMISVSNTYGNYTLVLPDSVSSDQVISSVFYGNSQYNDFERMPDCNDCDKYFRESITSIDNAKANGFTGAVIVSFYMDSKGFMKDFEIYGGKPLQKK